MFCNNCGTQLSDDSKYCYNCGNNMSQEEAPAPVQTADATPESVNNTPEITQAPSFEDHVAEAPSFEAPVAEVCENPYAQTYNTPAPQATQPYAESYPQAPAYTQPQVIPQPFNNAPQQGFYGNQPIQNYQAPAYNSNPIQTPAYQNYAVVMPPQETTLNKIFSYITAGILGFIFLLFLLPWATAYGEGITMFTAFSDMSSLEYLDLGGLALCSVLTLIDMGMLIPGIIMAIVKRHNMPRGFVITAAVFTFIIVTFFAIFMTESYASATIVPYLAFFSSVASLVFSILARKK